jgi:fructose/tagatose bisphosphate aldolase
MEHFIEETSVDFLAIAFGNAHGLYKGEPHLDLDLVAEIRRRVDAPLVMHGGTGLFDEQFHAAIAAGICKINFATSIMNTAADNMRLAAAKPDASMFDIYAGVRAAYSQWCGRLYEIFDAAGRV